MAGWAKSTTDNRCSSTEAVSRSALSLEIWIWFGLLVQKSRMFDEPGNSDKFDEPDESDPFEDLDNSGNPDRVDTYNC